MLSWFSRALRALPAAALLAAILPAAAGAQPVPSYAHHEDTITGRISSIRDKWTIEVHDRKGYLDTVRLHQGTVINPTGITLEPGFKVTITGHPAGPVFVANEIDTPYRTVGMIYPYYGYAPYAYYPYTYAPYPYGPVIVPHVWLGFGWRR
jgi:hypothetical protein